MGSSRGGTWSCCRSDRPDDGRREMSDVSRETPPTPSVARGVFADRLPQAEQYAALLASAGVTRGLIGPREAPRLWERHLLNCALLADLIPEAVTVADVGSGAGLPGLVLALRRPDLVVTLIEPLLRRATFLEEAVAALALANVEVVRARAEDLQGGGKRAGRTFDVVTSRAVAPLDRLASWSLPLVRDGGLFLPMKGASVAEEVEAARTELRRYGASTWSLELIGEGVVDPPVTVLRVEKRATQQGGRGR